MSEDFYPFVDSGDPAPDNRHLNGVGENSGNTTKTGKNTQFATRIAVYDDMLSTPRVIVVEPQDVRTYLEETTNTVYRAMKEQGGSISLMVIREIVENFIHANFAEPIISILDDGNTIRFADQGPGIDDKERAFEFGITSANREMKRYIRGTGAGFPMVQQYIENKGGAVSIEDNMGQGTVVTVSVDPARVQEIERTSGRGAAVRAGEFSSSEMNGGAEQAWAPQQASSQMPAQNPYQQNVAGGQAQAMPQQQGMPWMQQDPNAAGGFAAQNPWMQQPMQGMAAQMSPYGYAPNMPNPYMQNGYVQNGYPQNIEANQSFPQQQAQMGYPNFNQPTTQMPAEPYVSDRGQQALAYLAQAGQCGPTDLNRAFGSSVPTWSRELDKLAESGLVIKRGQKFHLTELGQTWTQRRTA